MRPIAAVLLAASLFAWTGAAEAQSSQKEADPGAEAKVTAGAGDVDWIAGAAGGVIDGNGTAEPFGTISLSRKLGRFYVRGTATGFRSTVLQADVALPSTFALGSIGGGGTFGNWFVDGYATGGRQFYGSIVTDHGTRKPTVEGGSGVFGAGLSGGRFVRIAKDWYVTPSIGVQYARFRTLFQTYDYRGAEDAESDQSVLTGSGTLRLDRFFGARRRSFVGLSASVVHATSSIVALGVRADYGRINTPDTWAVTGGSASVEVAHSLWIDLSATRTVGAKAGDVTVASAGVRIGF